MCVFSVCWVCAECVFSVFNVICCVRCPMFNLVPLLSSSVNTACTHLISNDYNEYVKTPWT